MLAYQIQTVYAVAHSVGRDCNNPEGGLPHDADDEMIIETVIDIAQGAPYNERGLSIDSLTDDQRTNIVRSFHDGAYDR